MKRFLCTMLFAIGILFASTVTGQPVCGASMGVEVTSPVVEQNEQIGKTTVSFDVDAQAMGSSAVENQGYEVTVCLYREGQMVSLTTRRLHVLKDRVTLELEGMTEYDSCKIFALNGTSLAPETESIHIAGDAVTTTRAAQYAMVTKLWDAESTPAVQKPEVQLFLSDGTSGTFAIKKLNDYDPELGLFKGENGRVVWDRSKIEEGMLIHLETGSRGQITEILGVGGLGADLSQTTKAAIQDITSKGYWKKQQISSNAAIFAVEDTGKGVKPFRTTLAYEDVLGTDDVNVQSYIYNTETKVIDAMVLEADFLMIGTRYGVIENVEKSGETTRYTGYINGRAATFSAGSECQTSLPEDRMGELFQIVFDSPGAAGRITPFAELSDSALHNIETGPIAGGVTRSGLTFQYGENHSLKLAKNCKIYTQENGYWKVGELNTLTELTAGDEVSFYDIFGDDERYDVAVIRDNNFALQCAVALGLTDQAGEGGRPQIQLLSANGSVKNFEIADFGEQDGLNALFQNTGGRLTWNKGQIAVGDLLRFGVNSTGKVNVLEGVGGLGSGITTGASPEGINRPIENKYFWGGKEFTEDSVIFGRGEGILSDPDTYYIYKWYDLEEAFDMTVYAFIAADDQMLAAVVEDNLYDQGPRHGIVTGVDQGGEQVRMTGYIEGKAAEFLVADKDAIPHMLLEGDFSTPYQIIFDSKGVARSFLLLSDAVKKAQEEGGRRLKEILTGPLSGEYYLENQHFVFGENYIFLDRNCGVYLWQDGAWSVGEMTALDALTDGESVEFYDVWDEDGVYDLVFVKKAATLQTELKENSR